MARWNKYYSIHFTTIISANNAILFYKDCYINDRTVIEFTLGHNVENKLVLKIVKLICHTPLWNMIKLWLISFSSNYLVFHLSLEFFLFKTNWKPSKWNSIWVVHSSPYLNLMRQQSRLNGEASSPPPPITIPLTQNRSSLQSKTRQRTFSQILSENQNCTLVASVSTNYLPSTPSYC